MTADAEELKRFVGFYREAGRIWTRLPRAHSRALRNRGAQASLNDASVLLRILRRYALESKAFKGLHPLDNTEMDTVLVGSAEMADVLQAALSLWDDYQQSGPCYIKSTRRDLLAEADPIDWPRTIAKRMAIVEDDTPLYVEPIYRVRRHDPNSRFFLLHLAIILNIGDLFGIDSGLSIGISLNDAFPEYITEPNRISQDFAHLMYRDRPHALATLMTAYCSGIRILSGAARETGDLMFGVSNFERVWEHMLRVLFGNAQGRGFATLPAGEWQSAQSERAGSGISPIADGCFLLDSPSSTTAVLFDAKEKESLNWEGPSGAAGDHYKQIVYRILLPEAEDIEIFNVLLFPDASVDKLPLIRMLGRHSWNSFAPGTVYELCLSYDTVARAFAGDTPWDKKAVQSILVDLLRQPMGAHRAR